MTDGWESRRRKTLAGDIGLLDGGRVAQRKRNDSRRTTLMSSAVSVTHHHRKQLTGSLPPTRSFNYGDPDPSSSLSTADDPAN